MLLAMVVGHPPPPRALWLNSKVEVAVFMCVPPAAHKPLLSGHHSPEGFCCCCFGFSWKLSLSYVALDGLELAV